jgi:hypothetical protein
MGIASIRLADGTVVTATFQDNGDGTVGTGDNGEAERAVESLRAELERTGRHGSLVNSDSKIIIIESGTATAANHRVDVSSGSLLRGGTVRLFSAPEVTLTDHAWDRGAMWTADGNTTISGRSYTMYREASRWEDGHEIPGRRVAVPEGYTGVNSSWRNVMVDANTLPGAEPVVTPEGVAPTPRWETLGSVYDRNHRNVAAYGGRIPTGDMRYVADAAPVVNVPPADTALAWSTLGPQEDGFMYFRAPNGFVARRSIAHPAESYVTTNPVSGSSLAGVTWRGADSADGVPANPPIVAVGSGTNAHQYMLARATPATDGEWDMFVGTRIGSNPPETLTFRMRHGVDNAAYEVRQGDGAGATWVDPATYTTPAARPVVPRRHATAPASGGLVGF